MNTTGIILAYAFCAVFGAAAMFAIADEHIRRFKKRNAK